MNLTAPALLTYSYLPLTGPNVADGREYLDLLWRHLRDNLGFEAPVDGLGVPTELPPPDVPLHGNGSRLLAARERREEEVWQACVRVEHDVVCLAVMTAPTRSSDPAGTWALLEQSLTDRAPRTNALLGESRLFLALTTGEPDTTAESVRAAAPRPMAVGWSHSHDELTIAPNGDRARLWELGASRDERLLRRLVLVAPRAHERGVDRLVWTVGDGKLTPLARYLLHAAKLRYQIRVFQNSQLRERTSERLDTLEEELLRADGSARDEVLARLTRAHQATDLTRTRLTRMRRGVDVIAGNLHNALGTYVHVHPGGPVTDDLALTRWFTERLDDELDQMGEAYERARTVLGPRVPAPARPAVTSASTREPLVFISYIHDSEEHKAQVLRFATFLREHGIDAQLDRWCSGARQDWYSWALDLIPRSDFVIVVASPLCRSVGDGQIPNHLNLGGQSEMTLLRELLQRDRATWTRKLIPVVLPGRDWEELPLFLQPRTADHYPVTDLSPAGAEDLLRVLTGHQPHSPPPLGPRVTFPRPD